MTQSVISLNDIMAGECELAYVCLPCFCPLSSAVYFLALAVITIRVGGEALSSCTTKI